MPGRTGLFDGAVRTEDAVRAMVDLVPLAGGSAQPDPARGLGKVLPHARPLPRHALVVVADPGVPIPPTDLPARVRGCVLDPGSLASDGSATVLTELTNTLRRHDTVIAVGSDKGLSVLAEALPSALAQHLARVPHRELDQLDGGPYGVIHDPLLGYLGAFHHCGRWHLDWRRVYARSTSAGLAVTLLRQRSPRLVDVLVAGGVPGEVAPCPRHGSPVVLT